MIKALVVGTASRGGGEFVGKQSYDFCLSVLF